MARISSSMPTSHVQLSPLSSYSHNVGSESERSRTLTSSFSLPTNGHAPAMKSEDDSVDDAECRICLCEIPKHEEFHLDCQCRGYLASVHPKCASKWFTSRGNTTCEICEGQVNNVPITITTTCEVCKGQVNNVPITITQHANGTRRQLRNWWNFVILAMIHIGLSFLFLYMLLEKENRAISLWYYLITSGVIGIAYPFVTLLTSSKRQMWVRSILQLGGFMLVFWILFSLLKVLLIHSIWVSLVVAPAMELALTVVVSKYMC